MSSSKPKPPRSPVRARLKLRHVLFGLLLVAGIVPLLISTVLLIRQNRDRLESAEEIELTLAVQELSEDLERELGRLERDLEQVGQMILRTPGPGSMPERLGQTWLTDQLETAARAAGLRALWVGDPQERAVYVGPQGDAERLRVRQAAIFDGVPVLGFDTVDGAPAVSLAVPLAAPSGSVGAADPDETVLVVEGLLPLSLQEMVERRYRDDSENLGVLLLTDDGVARVLWTSDNVSDASRDALLANPDVVQVAESDQAFGFGTRYTVSEDDGRSVAMLAQVSPLPGTDWAVVVQKPVAAAFAAVDEMVGNAFLATVLLVALALALAVLAARWVSRPIQRFTETSHEIAEGNFGRRVEVSGLAVELADLARDFNRMSAHVESYVARLQRAAEVNRDLFIGSIRAFAAAIDAKDPYTRGHSERVASLARTIARQLQLPDADQQKVWIGALLHDVGKLGVEDRVLRKIGQLTDEEYEQMKAHTVIGAEIIRSIEPLREMVPTIRWHHEAWNGRGYPDGKRGEEIPLSARIVAVADTFDAVTTNRPYQKAHSMEEAIAIVTRLTGTRFDAKVVTAFLRAYESGEVRLPDPGPEPEKVASGLSDAVPAAF